MGIFTNPLPNHEAKGSGGGSNQVNTILGLEETPVNPAKTIRRDPSIVLGTSFSQPDVFIERRLFFQPGVSNKPICSRMDFSKSAVRDEESSSVNYFNSQGGSSQSVHPWTGPPLVIHVGKTSSSQPLDREASSNPIPSSGIVPQLTVAASSSPAAHSPSIISLGQGAPFHQTSPSQMTQFQSATSSGRGAPPSTSIPEPSGSISIYFNSGPRSPTSATIFPVYSLRIASIIGIFIAPTSQVQFASTPSQGIHPGRAKEPHLCVKTLFSAYFIFPEPRSSFRVIPIFGPISPVFSVYIFSSLTG